MLTELVVWTWLDHLSFRLRHFVLHLYKLAFHETMVHLGEEVVHKAVEEVLTAIDLQSHKVGLGKHLRLDYLLIV